MHTRPLDVIQVQTTDGPGLEAQQTLNGIFYIQTKTTQRTA